MNGEIIDIRTVETPGKGNLSFFECGTDFPFDIKRVYYTYDVPVEIQRGGHAHRDLKQLLFCPYGEIEVVLDDGNSREHIVLDNPAKGLVVEGCIWREMIWRKEGSVLAVAASELYSEDDYIRNYDDFLSEVFLGGGNR